MVTTVRFLRAVRRLNWEMSEDWYEGDAAMVIRACDALPEDLQAMEAHMVIVRLDVVNLYPCLPAAEVTKIVYEGVLKSGIVWSEIDYLECVRYIALNST